MVVMFITVSIGTISYISIQNETKVLNLELKKRGMAIAKALAYNSEYGVLIDNVDELQYLLERTLSLDDVFYGAVVDAKGTLMIGQGDIDLPEKFLISDTKEPSIKDYKLGGVHVYPFLIFSVPIVTKEVSDSKTELEIFTTDKEVSDKLPFLAGASKVLKKVGTAHVAMSTESTAIMIRSMRNNFFYFTCVFISLASLLIIFLINRMIRPIHELQSATYKVAHGDFSSHINILQDDELGDLGKSFNKMTENLQMSTVSIGILKESQRRFNDVVENIGDWIWEIDMDGVYTYSNDMVKKILGYTSDEIIGQHFFDFFHPDDREAFKKGAFDIFKRNEVFKDFLNRNITKSGKVVILETSGVPIKDDKGKLIGYRGVDRDITERKEYESELQKAKAAAEAANNAKSQFLANMSHEIRTPMNSIMGFTEMLLEEENNSEKKERLDIINRSGKKLLRLINDILDFSKIEAGKVTYEKIRFSPHKLFNDVNNIFAIQAQKKDVSFNIKIFESVPDFVFGDEQRIHQVVLNIVNNAVKFTKKGSIEVSCDYRGGTAYIEVFDTGIGIPEDKMQTIFFAFKQVDVSTTREYGGTGLGLAITKKLIDEMDGEITLKSEQNVGSCFLVKIPLPEVYDSDELLMSASESDEIELIREAVRKLIDLGEKKSNYTILIAEDNEGNQKLVGALLDKVGMKYEFTVNGKLAVEKLHSKRYDMLLLDMHMPVMDGEEVINIIKEDNDFKNLTVIALSAHAIKGIDKTYLDLGCDDYISKPIDKKVFYEKLYSYIVDVHNESKTSLDLNHGEISISDSEKKILVEIIDKLKRSCKIFEPGEIHFYAKQFSQFSEKKFFIGITEKLNLAADRYSDDDVLEVVKLLETSFK